MKDKTATTSKYGFITVVFLVIALSSLIFLISSYNRNSDKLNTTVNDLSHNGTDEERIDSALGLLYIAENNARMYSLYKDTSYYNAYKRQIQSVKILIDSLKNSNDNGNRFGELVSDKESKTQMFLRAQSLVDSILTDNSDSVLNAADVHYVIPKVKRVKLNPITDTVTKAEVKSKKSKGLFGRLSDAIKNKQDTAGLTVNNQLITNYRNDSLKMSYEKDVLASQVRGMKNHQDALENLKKKEKAVLEANHNLFTMLQSLLQDLKKQEIKMQAKRTVVLSKNAVFLTKNLKVSNRYITLFSALLALVILIILFVLYKNELALKKAKVQAENYAKLKSEFTATMSHEIRTPLHSIHAFADELNVQDNKEHQSEIIDAIKLSSKMLLSVVNNILDFTKIEKGKFKLESVVFNPKNIIGEILGGLLIQAKQKNLQLNGNINDSADTSLRGDAFHFRQILLNTVSNAIKYTKEGNVTVSAEVLKQSDKTALLRLKIADTGIGIAEKDIPHLFDEFSGSGHKEEIVSGSTGLGLNIVKKLIDLHKGKIFVKSEVNKGTVFTIELPYDIVADDTQKTASVNKIDIDKNAVNKAVSTPNLSDKKLKVFLVENDKFNQKFLSRLFEKQGASIQTAESAEDALTILADKKFDLILTDIGLPKMSGTELAKSIKNGNKANSDTIIFGITGFEKNQVENDVQYFSEWLIKPFKSQDLLDKVYKYFPQSNDLLA